MRDRQRIEDDLVHGNSERGRHVQQIDEQDWQDSGFCERVSLEPAPRSLGQSEIRELDTRGYVGSAWCAESTLGQSSTSADHRQEASGSWSGRPGEGTAVQTRSHGGRGARHQSSQPPGSVAASARPFLNKGPLGYVRSDERIWEDVCDELAAGYLDASGIEVLVMDGVVRLTGEVTTQHARQRAEQLADGCRGVKGVENLLRVRTHTHQRTSD